ncbi:hypothetical protein FRB99_008919 [Tulasnella sp. 403]|nr:hypothetical protein FRB99_008919 [Tulasnella sp. 403]
MFASAANVASLLLGLAILSQEVSAGRATYYHGPSRASFVKRVDDAQNSLELDPSLIGPNLAKTGQEVPTPGQVESLTSTNNFINFCLTQDVPLTNGTQLVTGSCNPIPIGRIISTDKMPVSRFTFPPNGGAIKANTPFTIKMTIVNLQTGFFTNPTTTYYAAPQQVNGNGVAQGHSHVVIESIPSFDTTDVSDPRNFAFFKGLNGVADGNGQLSADVSGGLPVGFYKMTSINAAANHQPLLVAVAQHGSIDDSAYFECTEDGKPSGKAIASGSVDAGDASESASVSADVTATATESVAAATSSAASVSDVATTTTASGSDATETASATETGADDAKPTDDKVSEDDKKSGDSKSGTNDATETTPADPTSTTSDATAAETSSSDNQTTTSTSEASGPTETPVSDKPSDDKEQQDDQQSGDDQQESGDATDNASNADDNAGGDKKGGSKKDN